MLCNGLNYQTYQLIDGASRGSLSNKYPEDDEELIENMASNESYSSTQGRPQRAAWIYEFSDNVALATK